MRILCVVNLSNIGMEYQSYAADYDGGFPGSTNNIFSDPRLSTPGIDPPNWQILTFTTLSNMMASTPKIFICPSDNSKFSANPWNRNVALGIDAANASSYFTKIRSSDDSLNDVLGGDRNLLIPSLGLDFQTAGNYNKTVTVHPSELSATNTGWSRDMHHYAGNVLLGDGSVQQESNRRPQGQFRGTFDSTSNSFDLFFPAL
jgi:hypothetical protein